MRNFCSAGLAIFFAALSVARVTGQSPPQDGFFALTDQLAALAGHIRSVPVTEPGVPVENVQGEWRVTVLKLTHSVVVVTFELPPKYKFYVQTSICELDKAPAFFADATILGEHETAATFYEANHSFHIVGEPSKYVRCMASDITISTNLGNQRIGEEQVHTSDERVLSQMSYWLLFLASRDSARAADFLPFVLDGFKKLFVASDAKGDLSEEAAKIGVFDGVFPFAVFDMNIPLDTAARNQAREFFQTLVLLRKKLSLVSPESAGPIARDEALLNKLR